MPKEFVFSNGNSVKAKIEIVKRLPRTPGFVQMEKILAEFEITGKVCDNGSYLSFSISNNSSKLYLPKTIVADSETEIIIETNADGYIYLYIKMYV